MMKLIGIVGTNASKSYNRTLLQFMQKQFAEKADIENQLASGTLSSDEIIKASQRFGELGDIIDEKTMRWLELSEI